MRKEKAKNRAFWQIGTLPFVALWAGSYIAAWMVLWGLFQWVMPSLSDTETTVVALSCVTLIPAVIQAQVVERLLNHRMRGWVWYTAVGALFTLITFNTNFGGTSGLVALMRLFLPAALAQSVWLWRRVQGAWLWPLATIVAGLLFILPIRDTINTLPIIILASLLYGLVQGSIMRSLWLQPKATEKAKIGAAKTTQPIENRAARLQDTADTSTPLIYGDTEQAASSSR